MTVVRHGVLMGCGWRSALLGGCAALFLVGSAAQPPAGRASARAGEPGLTTSPSPPNPIVAENALPGTSAGLAPETAPAGAIEGYSTEISALPGQVLHLHVSTNPAAPYQIDVYRLGWYNGAGSRLIGCTPSCSSNNNGSPQPAPAPNATGLVQANWPVTDTFALPANATSGYYRICFVLANGQLSSTYVIVRAPVAAAPSAILVQVPVNTWEAYNAWGGRSLYDLPAAQRANSVSFERPFAWNAAGNQDPLGWEYPLVMFLEQNGYDVSYQTDLETDADAASLLGHRLVIDIGHDEYWTQAMRNAWAAARDAGVNLAFMGSNDIYWRIRYQDNDQTVVDYKSGDDPVTDPNLSTGLMRVLAGPECELVGIQHQGGELNWPPGDYDVVPSSLSQPWFAGTGFTASSVLTGLVGVETDTIPAWENGAICGHQLTIYFQHNGGGDEEGNADVVSYTAPSGATVFAAGSRQLAWGLDDPPAISGRDHGLVDPRLQHFFQNLLNDLSARHTAALTLALTPPPKDPPPGRLIQVRAAIQNHGPDAAQALTLTLDVPPALTFVRVAGPGLTCTLTPLQCSLAPLPDGGHIDPVFTFRLHRRAAMLGAQVQTLIATNPNPQAAIASSTLN